MSNLPLRVDITRVNEIIAGQSIATLFNGVWLYDQVVEIRRLEGDDMRIWTVKNGEKYTDVGKFSYLNIQT